MIMYSYKLIFDDDDFQLVAINLNYQQAKQYYLNQSFTYWCADTNSEQSHKVIKIEQLD